MLDSSKLKARRKSIRKDEKKIIAEHSTYAQQKLYALDERIMNKTQAFQALKRSQKIDNKVLYR